MNILCSTDEKYAPYCGIMLTSLFVNSLGGDRINVYCMTDYLSSTSLKKFRQLADKYNATFTAIVVKREYVQGFPIKLTDHVSLVAYYRLFAQMFLPKEVDKIIYLDCDMIVNGSLTELWNTDVEDKAMAAVYDENYLDDKIYQRLHYPRQNMYFNSGMLLLNLKYWRENKVMERCLKYIADYPERLLFHDQDTINTVLNRYIASLPITYNFQTGFLYRCAKFDSFLHKEIEETIREEPVIIHFTGPSKPWHAFSNHPFVKYFNHFKAVSLWRACHKIYPPKSKIVRHWCTELIWRLHIKPRPATYIIKKRNIPY